MPAGQPVNAGAEYEIWVRGCLSERWADWFAGLAIEPRPGGETLLRGYLPDQPALFGVLNAIHGLNLTLLGVRRLEEGVGLKDFTGP